YLNGETRRQLMDCTFQCPAFIILCSSNAVATSSDKNTHEPGIERHSVKWHVYCWCWRVRRTHRGDVTDNTDHLRLKLLIYRDPPAYCIVVWELSASQSFIDQADCRRARSVQIREALTPQNRNSKNGKITRADRSVFG